MRLARISNGIDLNVVLASLSIYFPTTDAEIIIDGSSLQEQFAASPCSSINMNTDELRGLTKNISCTEETFRFMCEKFDSDSENFAAADTFPEIDRGLSLVLKHIGDYSEFLA